MKRFVCIHGHFYQPPRENAWLDAIETQDSAAPFHDWNDRITDECYGPNAAARIHNLSSEIQKIQNNYSKISFNFGPTLLSWLEKNRPLIYQAILEADLISQKQFNGHGSALAQVYNHVIMPLANRQDKITQIRWGIEDFKYRFNRAPEGMWLAETAVDLETLELLADEGIRFTILAPRQASKIRSSLDSPWEDVSDSRVDPRRPYRCVLSHGKTITLFFYDGHVAQDVAFSKLLHNGEEFANRLLKTLDKNSTSAQLAHIATDGESYGHHHRYGEMALAYAIQHIENQSDTQLTIYGEFLDESPATYEVEIFENSSWSCIHGIERWKSDCGCCSGGNPGWNQKWRAPLREALNFLRDDLSKVFEKHASPLFQNPWETRNRFIEIPLKKISPQDFVQREAQKTLSHSEKATAFQLLEMQHQCLLMFTSCGWFFDEISGIEPVQILQYASRAIQLAEKITGVSRESALTKILSQAPSNLEKIGDGSRVWDQFVKPSQFDLPRVAAHVVTSLLFEKRKPEYWYSYLIQNEESVRKVIGRSTTLFGKSIITHPLTLESLHFIYTLLHLGDHNITIGIQTFQSPEAYETLKKRWKTISDDGDTLKLLRILDQDFEGNTYTLHSLIRDTQSQIINQSLKNTFAEIEESFEEIYQENRPLLHILQKASFRTPLAISTTIDLLFNMRIQKNLEKELLNLTEFKAIIEEFLPWNPKLDSSKTQWLLRNRIQELLHSWEKRPEDTFFLNHTLTLIEIIDQLKIQVDFWEIQKWVFDYKNHHLAKLPFESHQLFSHLCKKLRIEI